MENVCKKCQKPLSAYDKKNICQSCRTKQIDKIKNAGKIVGGVVVFAFTMLCAVAKAGEIINSDDDETPND